jgi:hypothetical protein
MSYSVQIDPQHPNVIVNVLPADFNPGKELPAVLEELKAAFESMTVPFYYISDTSDAKWGFGEMVQAMAASAGRNTGFLKNPLLQEIIVVSTSNLINLGVNALGQEQYGIVNARTMPNLKEALRHIESSMLQRS